MARLLSNTLRIEWAFIYGSIARSEEHAASDVDLLFSERCVETA